MIKNKKGITLMELLAYLSIVSIVVVLLTSTLTYAVKSYDKVNGEGAIYIEANYIMNTLISQVNAFNPDFARSCKVDDVKIENCIELVIDRIRVINPYLGIIEEIPPSESGEKIVKIRIENNNIFIKNMQLNNKSYAVERFNIVNINGDNVEKPNLSYDCNDGSIDICQNFTLSIRLSIYKINKNGDKTSNIYAFENRFSF